MTLAEEFALRYPEFHSPPAGQNPATDGQVDYWIAEAERFLTFRRWRENHRPAMLAWAAAHLARALKQGLNGPATGEPGPVASASVGGESVSYFRNNSLGRGSSTDDWMLLYPPYGPEYLMLRDGTLSGVEATRTAAGEGV